MEVRSSAVFASLCRMLCACLSASFYAIAFRACWASTRKVVAEMLQLPQVGHVELDVLSACVEDAIVCLKITTEGCSSPRFATPESCAEFETLGSSIWFRNCLAPESKAAKISLCGTRGRPAGPFWGSRIQPSNGRPVRRSR